MDALQAKAAIPDEPVRPPGAFTISDWCKRYGVSEWSARNQIKKLRRDGDARLIGNGRTAYYVLVPKRPNSKKCTGVCK